MNNIINALTFVVICANVLYALVGFPDFIINLLALIDGLLLGLILLRYLGR